MHLLRPPSGRRKFRAGLYARDRLAGPRSELRSGAQRGPRESIGSRAPPGNRPGAGLAPDRWGRSVTDLLATLQELEHLGVGFVSLTEALDLSTPAGHAMAGLLASSSSSSGRFYESELGAGLAHAAGERETPGSAGNRGRTSCGNRKLHRAVVSKSEIARRVQIGRTSVRRILGEKS